jgi:hypothetical protein
MSGLTRRAALAAGPALALSQTTLARVELAAPALTFVFAAKVLIAAPVEQGQIDGKRKRFIPITGGQVTGPRLSGIIVPGGGDWQAILPGGLTEILARYAIKADDGTIITVTNPGVRVASPDVIERLAKGEDVDPKLYYFRTTPSFEAPPGPHEWLRRKVFVGRGIRRPDHVHIEFFMVD